MSELGYLEASLVATTLPLNETVYRDCPSCGGRKKFSVTRTPHGVLWNCFKLSCREKGSDIVAGELLPPNKKATKLKLNPYTREWDHLTVEDRNYFLERFGVIPEGARVTSDGCRYLLPVFTPQQWVRGWVAREPWDDWAPLSGTGSGPKALLYMHQEGPTQSWYGDFERSRVVLVEDQMSGYCVAEAGERSCALMGISLDNDKVREIAMQRPQEVIIALDADATEQAFRLARKWGLAFRKTRVAVLEQDLKDTPIDDIPEVLGL